MLVDFQSCAEPPRLLSPEQPQLFIHFPGCGGTTVARLAHELFGRHAVGWNTGCAAQQTDWGYALTHSSRCPCPQRACLARVQARRALSEPEPEPRSRACMLHFFAWENPVAAPLSCFGGIWVVLRDPVERILSRMHKEYGRNPPTIRTAQAIAALSSTTWLPACPVGKIGRANQAESLLNATMPPCMHEFTGSASLNDWYIRSLLGPAVFTLPLDAVNESHLEAAQAWLGRVAVVLPLANMSALPRLLGAAGLLPAWAENVTVGYEVSGVHSSYNDSLPVNDSLLTLLRRYNALDTRLYAHAQALFEERWACLRSRSRRRLHPARP